MENNLTVEYIYNHYECKCDNEKKCINQIESTKQLLEDYVNLLEQNPKLFDNF